MEKRLSTEEKNSTKKALSMEDKHFMEKELSTEEKNSMEDGNSAEEAVGLLEVFGLVCAFMAADAGCKAADVRLEVFDKNKPANADALPVPLLVTVKFRGSVAAVEAAMEAAETVANPSREWCRGTLSPDPPGTPERC